MPERNSTKNQRKEKFMQIICISGGGSNRTKALTNRLAHKLGYQSLNREDALEKAIKEGIQVSKLETATIKPQMFTERLALEREYYRAFMTAYLGGLNTENGMVYNGRSGHLLFSGIDHVLKVRVVEDETTKVKEVMQQLGIDSKKARRYLNDVEADRSKWARAMHGLSLEDATHYDVMLNLGHMSVENAAAALAAIAQLPDFQVTPASRRSLEDLVLGANARVLLARDERTFRANVKVRADRGAVTVTYLPQDAGIAQIIPEVLAPLPGVRELSVTMATTNLLWIEEAFESPTETYQHVVEIASKWNAAIELLQFIPQDSEGQEELLSANEPALLSQRPDFVRECVGGIEEEGEIVCEDKGFQSMQETLSRLGCFGGGRRIMGGAAQVVKSIDRTVPYSLIVIGNLFLDKGHSAQMRMTRQLQGHLSDQINAPIVNAEDLKSQYLFGRQDLLKLLGCLGLFSLVLFLILTYQEPVLKFLSGVEFKAKALAAVAVFLFVPTMAYLYGTVARSLMKLIRME
jgi:cytidylate kinase